MGAPQITDPRPMPHVLFAEHIQFNIEQEIRLIRRYVGWYDTHTHSTRRSGRISQCLTQAKLQDRMDFKIWLTNANSLDSHWNSLKVRNIRYIFISVHITLSHNITWFNLHHVRVTTYRLGVVLLWWDCWIIGPAGWVGLHRWSRLPWHHFRPQLSATIDESHKPGDYSICRSAAVFQLGCPTVLSTDRSTSWASLELCTRQTLFGW